MCTLQLGKEAATQVVYKGGGDAALAVLSREVDFNCANLTSVIGNIKAGKLRALMTTTPERWKDIPEVPTVRELGYPRTTLQRTRKNLRAFHSNQGLGSKRCTSSSVKRCWRWCWAT